MLTYPVMSSHLRRVGYSAVRRTLEVEFQSGGVYRYHGVPASVYRALLAAPSLGRYFNAHVRAAYPYERLTAPASKRAAAVA